MHRVQLPSGIATGIGGQIALIDTLVDLKDKEAVDQLAKLKDAKGVDPSVKKHADWGINKLRS